MEVNETKIKVGDKEFSIGQQTPLGTIKTIFTSSGEYWFTTEEGAHFRARYLHGC